MSEEFVRKDYHNSTMREIKALMERNIAQHRELTVELRGEIKNLHTRIDGVIDTFGVAIDDIKEKQNHTLTKWGIIVAIVVGVVQIAISFFMKK